MTSPADELWEKVDDLFADASANTRIPKMTIIAAAMQAACFATMAIDCDEETFVELCRRSWQHSIMQIRQMRAEQDAENGKAAKA